MVKYAYRVCFIYEGGYTGYKMSLDGWFRECEYRTRAKSSDMNHQIKGVKIMRELDSFVND